MSSNSRQLAQPEGLDRGVVIADAEGVVVARGDEAAAADAAADRPLHGVGVLVGEAEAGEETDTLTVRLAVGEVDRRIAGVLDVEVLPAAPVDRPGVVFGLGRETFAGFEDRAGRRAA